MTRAAPVLGCGTYTLNLQCPDCRVVTEVAILLDTRLTVDSTGAKLGAKLGAKPVDHRCGQLRLITATVSRPPEHQDDDDDQPGFFREPDHQERAAGDMT